MLCPLIDYCINIIIELVRESKEGFNRNSLRPAILAINRLSSMSTPGLNTLLKVDGVVMRAVGKLIIT